VFKKNDMVRPARLLPAPFAKGVYLKENNLGQVIRTSTLDYGRGRRMSKVQVLWLTGDFIGKTSIHNEQDIEHVS
tara:strand:- start:959 stop:1183 length:225 start_codon:yes stop_codon:yes gene_type:complete